ncbi:MAG: ABC transporter substrate-binding protein [Bacteriovorax sp.]|nr:ABC transporter substrate-binding protein [Bacteriovorax sp.]
MKHFAHFILIFVCISKTTSAKTFINCSEASPASFNPQIVTDATSYNASAITLYNRLLRFELGTTQMIPSLAESYTISKDEKTYTFTLRKGVKFHKTSYFKPTRDFNAEDVIFSINRQRLLDHPYHSVSGGIYTQYENNIRDNISNIEAIDPYKVQITLREIQAPFLAYISGNYMSILSAEYADKLTKENRKQDIDQLPIGTGPFSFISYTKDSLIRYSAHEQYWDIKNYKGKSENKIDKLIFAITPDQTVRYQKLRAHECHFVTLPSIADLSDMKLNDQVRVMDQEGLNIGYLAMNVTKKPFDNILVRQAINHALNRKLYLDAIYRGTAIIASNPVPPALWSYDKTLMDYDFNPAKAKLLLKKAGFEKGFETEMWTLPVTRPYNPDGKKMGELMQADLANIGIKVKLISFDWPTFLKKSRTGEQSMIQFGWTGNNDPDTFLNDLLSCASVDSGNNTARWCNKEFNELVTQARKVTNQKKRTELYKKAQRIFKLEAPWVTLAHAKVFRVMDKKVKNFKIDPFGYDYFDQVELE